MKTTAELLRDHKAAHGVTDQQIADAVGVRQPSVSDWVSGRAVPTDQHLPAIAKMLGMSTDELAVSASYSRRIRAKSLDEALGILSQLEASVRRLGLQVGQIEQRLDELERPAPRRSPRGQRSDQP